MESTNESPLCENTEFWMTNLPRKLKTVPLIHLAIPGSHDSFTSSITRSSKISPDADAIVQKLKCFGPIVSLITSRWAKTQECSVTDQLNTGIRYFDLRIATKDGTEQMFFVHGLYSDDVVSGLNEIENFLDAHPKEVVVLDCQHFYDFIKRDHERLMQLLEATFGRKMLPYTRTMTHITLDFMTEQFNYQVIAIYRNDAARFGHPYLWPSVSFPTPWPETDEIPKLINKLNDGLSNRPPHVGYVSQCVLTPTSGFVFRHLFGSLKEACFLPLDKAKYAWLDQQCPGPGGVNIVISDFVEFESEKFTKEIISLNEKLMGDIKN